MRCKAPRRLGREGSRDRGEQLPAPEFDRATCVSQEPRRAPFCPRAFVALHPTPTGRAALHSPSQQPGRRSRLAFLRRRTSACPPPRFGDPRVMALLAALCLFRLLPEGFRNRDPRPHVAARPRPRTYTPGQLTYDLRRLRLKGLIERCPARIATTHATRTARGVGGDGARARPHPAPPTPRLPTRGHRVRASLRPAHLRPAA